MTISHILNDCTSKLKAADISTARLDCLVLLEDLSGKDRAWLLAHPEFELIKAQLATLDKQIERRVKHEPLAYIRGKSAFYGRDFFVTADTLQPRPETETLVELALDLVKSRKLKFENVIDVGTGSGAIAITIKLERPELQVFATDISPPCLEVAQKNAKQLGANVEFTLANLIEPIPTINYQLPTIVLANLPYVPDDFTINQAAMFEPEIAIFGGKDGLDYYRQLFDQLKSMNASVAAILTESLPTQHADLAELAETYGFKLDKTQDFIQLFLPE